MFFICQVIGSYSNMFPCVSIPIWIYIYIYICIHKYIYIHIYVQLVSSLRKGKFGVPILFHWGHFHHVLPSACPATHSPEGSAFLLYLRKAGKHGEKNIHDHHIYHQDTNNHDGLKNIIQADYQNYHDKCYYHDYYDSYNDCHCSCCYSTYYDYVHAHSARNHKTWHSSSWSPPFIDSPTYHHG